MSNNGIFDACPTPADVMAGSRAYRQHDKRDSIYTVATFLIGHYWGKPGGMADALGVLLLVWNQAFYRYGGFDYDALEMCIARNMDALQSFRAREIDTFSATDELEVARLFEEFRDALKIGAGKMAGRRSPVAVAKALHLLAPAFFPIWDSAIASSYGCGYQVNPARAYIAFCWKTSAIAQSLARHMPSYDRTIAKLIDEFNYSKYTQGWV
ncbi:MAG: hypothetical protein NTU88_10955 [Armatimonadetes bacterium]|nr:hypothetical protein [Armatimonadota bacterium]